MNTDQTTTAATDGMAIAETGNRNRIDRESGSLVVVREFEVGRTGHDAHTVTIEIDEAGAPQHEHCDCRGFRYRKHCCHVEAICASEMLGVAWD